MLTDVVLARSTKGAAHDGACMSSYAKSVPCLHMSSKIRTQSKAPSAFAALEWL
jgi:hypothetical protein